MLSGDNAQTAQAVAKKLNIREVYSNVLPKDKLDIIQQFQAAIESAWVTLIKGDLIGIVKI